MASNKETPRQKMISMMYLVLTALLALNVSDQVLKGFVTVDESIDRSKKILSDNNKQIEEAFKEYIEQGNTEAKPYYEKCLSSKQKIESLIDLVEKMKLKLISATESTSKPDTVQMRFMKKLDDFDTPTEIFIGSDENNPKTGELTAHTLKLNLENLSRDLSEDINKMVVSKQLDENDASSLIEKISTIQPTDRNKMEDGLMMNWILDNFYNIPTAAVITNFDKIQTDLKNIESELFRVMASSSNKYLFKVNKLQAKVLAPNAYVLSGQPFTADILLSASSNAFSSERMRVLIGASYDSTQNKLINEGNSIPVADGIGRFETVSTTQGEQTLNGLIEYKNPKGKFDYYPFSYSYMVAAPFSAVGAENMNVFYVGVDNPLSASAAGFSPTDLSLSVSGCGAKLKTVSPGKYMISVGSTGTCAVSVMAKTPQGIKQQGPSKVFRVKSIPPPVAKINGKPVLSTLELKQTELATINSLGAVCMGFEFPVNAVVKEATIIGFDKNGNLIEEKIHSPILTEKAKQIVRDTKAGKRTFIEGIKVSINDQVVPVPDVIIKRKS